MSSSLGKLTYAEIGGQPEALAAALAQLERQQDWVEKYLRGGFDRVVFIGSGSSYYQALVMAATYRLWTGRDAIALPSSEIYLFRDLNAVPGRSYLLVGVSRSGESSEVLLALESVKGLENWTTCGITCYENSSMAKLTECLVSPLGKEQSTVMTKSFSSMTFLMQAAIAKAANRSDLSAQLEEAARFNRDVVAKADGLARELAYGHDFNKYIYLGLGAYTGLGLEASLKIKEMACVWTESFGTLEFRHGPKAIVGPGTFVCLLLSERARGYELKVAQEMKEFGAHVVLLTARKDRDTAFADAVFEVGGERLTDEARAVLYMPLPQYLGYYASVRKGLNPDEPNNLTQVVKI